MQHQTRPRYAHSLLAFALAVASALPFAGHADSGDRVQAKATFAIVWERLQNSGFSGKHEGLDWAKLKAKHQPDIEGANDIEALRREINELLADLKASHLMLLPAEATATPTASAKDDDSERADDSTNTKDDEVASGSDIDAERPALSTGFGDIGLRLALIEGRLRVERVAADSPAQRAGVKPGWAVERIGRFDARAASKTLRKLPPDAQRRGETMLLAGAQSLLDQRAPEQRIAIRFHDARGKARALTLSPAAHTDVESMTLPGIPPLALRYNERRLPLPEGGCALHIEFTQWAMPVFEKLVESLRKHGDCRGVVIDLRGNTGGLMASLSAVGGLFLDESASLGTLTTGGGDLKLTALPRVVDNAGQDIRRFTGPMAILIDGASVSCSDIFPASMQALQRARIFGSRSAGMALPSASVPLPSGDRLLYPIAEFVDSAGRRIEGIGTIPDQFVVPTIDALSAGRDPVLDAATTWFSTNPKVSVVLAPKTQNAPASHTSTSSPAHKD